MERLWFKRQCRSSASYSALEGSYMTARERLQMQLAQALTRSDSPEVRAHLRAALREYEKLPLTPLVECPCCGALGLPERIQHHDCTTFLRKR